MLVELDHVTKHFPVGRSFFGAHKTMVHAMDDVNLQIAHGRTLALVGESGSGKTTLGRIVAGLLEPTSGRVLFEGQDLNRIKGEEKRRLRRQLQFIFQDPYAALNPRHNVRSILARPFEVHTKLSSAEIDAKVKELLDLVGLRPPEAMMFRYPHQFSGGQRQRLVFARAIALRPKFIVADEPVSALDMTIKAQLLTLLRGFQSQLDLTFLFITHELAVVRTIAQEIAVMYLGEIVEQASVEQLFAGPLHPYTQALLMATPRLNPYEARQRPTIVLTGDTPSPTSPPFGCRFHTRCPYVEAICNDKPPALRQIGGRWVRCHLVGRPDFPLTQNLALGAETAPTVSAASTLLPDNTPLYA